MRLEKALVDQGFQDEVTIHGALLGIDVEAVRRNRADQGKGARRLTTPTPTCATPRAGRVNVPELLADLRARHDEATTRAGELRDQIEHFTASLAETEAHPADLATTRKVIVEFVPAGDKPRPPEPTTTYRRAPVPGGA
ncbi:hypothetical protein [Streptomyces sp. HUAS TT7]|uniref:hypothetical protein n=1 Tax=Streptomyces sp. HUAS TT7 TaxID=3447507 RepID=UPI003F65528A